MKRFAIDVPGADDRQDLAPPAPRRVSRWPFYGQDEIAAVTEILRSGRVNAMVHGEACGEFERRFAAYVGGHRAIAVANGTLALELALRALGIGAGDEVIVSPRSYFASVSCIVAVGAKPVFADIDPVSQNIDPACVAQAISARTRAVICVHLAGWPCDMDALVDLCRHHGIKLIEDCAQALGAEYHGQKVGSFGDAAAFSFCTDKILSTGGEGGMLLVRDSDVWDKAWSYKDHGKSRAKLLAKDGHPAGCFRWLHDGFGSNYRLTEMQAAIGTVQLGKLPGWLATRRRNAAALNAALRDNRFLETFEPPSDIRHAHYKYYCHLRVSGDDDGAARNRLVAAVQRRGVPIGSGSCPEIYRELAIAGTPLAPARALPMAKRTGATSMMLPVDPSLGLEAIEWFAAVLNECVLEQMG